MGYVFARGKRRRGWRAFAWRMSAMTSESLRELVGWVERSTQRSCSPLLRHRHRDAGDLDLEHAEARAGGEVHRLPVVAAEGDVGGVGKAVHDAAELLALRIEDVEAA